MRRGAQEIMDHPWFSSLNFTELYNKTVSTAKIYTHKATRVPKRYKKRLRNPPIRSELSSRGRLVSKSSGCARQFLIFLRRV